MITMDSPVSKALLEIGRDPATPAHVKAQIAEVLQRWNKSAMAEQRGEPPIECTDDDIDLADIDLSSLPEADEKLYLAVRQALIDAGEGADLQPLPPPLPEGFSLERPEWVRPYWLEK